MGNTQKHYTTTMMKQISLLALVAVVAGFAPAGPSYCYKVEDHKCHCDMCQDECKPRPQYLWTESCYKPCTTDGSGVGCYNQAGEHQCDCTTSKADCKLPHVWTEGCASCESGGSMGMGHGYAIHVRWSEHKLDVR